MVQAGARRPESEGPRATCAAWNDGLGRSAWCDRDKEGELGQGKRDNHMATRVSEDGSGGEVCRMRASGGLGMAAWWAGQAHRGRHMVKGVRF